jgi:hypothetical protein
MPSRQLGDLLAADRADSLLLFPEEQQHLESFERTFRFDDQSLPQGMCFISASERQELHLHTNQVIKDPYGLSLPSLIHGSFRENGSHYPAVASDARPGRLLAAERKVISQISRTTVEIATSCRTGER